MRLDELQKAVASGAIDTVVVGFTDHYGRLMGKRFDADFFLEDCVEAGTHACDYLLTVDMDMEPVEGYASTNWQRGYGDFHLVPDLSTLRRAGWSDGVALVIADAVDEGDHTPVQAAPRSILARQVADLRTEGLSSAAASELEFFLYRTDYRTANEADYRDLTSAGWYVEDYHLLQAARVDDYVGAARRALRASEIPVENSKGEAAIGQHELNIAYCDVAEMADRHAIMKQALKELADAQGCSVTFMAKPDAEQPGSSCHLHLSLWHSDATSDSATTTSNAFWDDGPSDLFRWFLGGWMQHLPSFMPFYAPTINSYKRYRPRSWAPSALAWSHDNRTCAFRTVGSGQSFRIECRVPGADVNPYLAYAAALASGLDGIRNRVEPPSEYRGDAYADPSLDRVPTSLGDAVDRFRASADTRRLLGDEVVDHYAHHFEEEVAAYSRSVTDWELRRYFERI
ncbi:MAG: glutamine synthetase family protein [Acidimicrobiales bacterium]